MGVSDWSNRRRPGQPAGNLLDSLIAAFSAQQYELMVKLINENTETIRERFPQWVKAPEEIRNDPEAMGRYVRTLHIVASLFERAGDDTLMTRITGGDEFNQKAAKALTDEGRGAEALTLLETGLSRLDETSGPGVQHIRAQLIGAMGLALLATGDRRAAERVTREALHLCESLGDEDGIRAYTHNLDHIGTHHMPANDGTDATVSVVFRDEQGRLLTLDELRTVPGNFRWELRCGPLVPAEASRLHQEGRAAGSRGDYDTAHSLLTRLRNSPRSGLFPSTIGRSPTCGRTISSRRSGTFKRRSSSRLAASMRPRSPSTR
jgi:hypothetical protein